jgi:Carboxypeptidase regulatory-like domain/TonB dependent receptor
MRKILGTLCLLACFCLDAHGQSASTTSLVGSVLDSSGAGVEGAAVTVTNVETKEVYSAKTSAAGYYEVQFIKAGIYVVTAKKDGFETLTRPSVNIANNQVVRADFTMEVGRIDQVVEVFAGLPPIATDDATLSENIATQETHDLPLNGRDVLQLATTTPTVIAGLKTPSSNPGNGEGFIGAGTREIQNSLSLDGISIMSNLITEATFHPNVDAVQEVQVQTGTYPAQYGGYLGVQINAATKTGTDTLHGSVFEFLRNNYFDARNFFDNTGAPQAPLRQNQFGFELGGPIVLPKLYDGHNRTFFMVSYQGLRNTQSTAGTGFTLSALQRTGDFSELGTPIIDPTTGNPFPGNVIPTPRLSSQALAALKYMPMANLPFVDLNTPNFAGSAANTSNDDQTIDRIDQSFGQKTRLFFRYAYQDASQLNGTLNPANGYTQPVTDRNFVIAWTQVLSPTKVNDLRFGRQHTTIDSVNLFHTQALANAGTDLGIPGFTTDLANSGLPEFDLAGYFSIGGDNMSSSNWYQTDTTWQATDVFNWSHGPHTVSAGVEIRKLITLRTANNDPRGNFDFSGQYTGNAAADFLLGLPDAVTTPGALYPGGAKEYRDGFFVMDKWQFNHKLTLTYGLRYELPTVPHSATGNGRILDPTDTFFIPTTVPKTIPFNNANHKDFAPRFGFAYRPVNNWVLRGGAGIYYNANQLNTYTLTITNPPYSTIASYTNDPVNPTLSLANPVPANPPGTTGKTNAFTINPYLPTQTMYQWSGGIERSLWQNAGFEVQYLGSRSIHLDRSYYNNQPLVLGPGLDARRPNQNFLRIRTIQNDEIASYQGLSFILRQHFAKGLSGLFSYTWSHTLDVTSDSNDGGAPMNAYDWHRDYGSSNWDVRHRVVASFDYELPFFKSSSQLLAKYALGGWQFSGIITAQSGFPYSITLPNDQANSGRANQRPDLVGAVHSNCGSSNLVSCIDATAYAVPAQYTFGNLGRNTMRGPGLVEFDNSMFKNLPIGERLRLQLRLEVFNLFNHPSFSNPGNDLGGGDFGAITSTSNNNRQMQVAMKILF